MRRRLVVLLSLVLAASTLAAAPVAAVPEDEPEAVADQLLVGYQRGTSPAQREAARRVAGARLLDRVVPGDGSRLEVELVGLPSGSDRSQAERRFEANPTVAYAEPNWKITVDATSNDPDYLSGRLWGMYGDATTPTNEFGSQAGEAWAGGNTGSSTVYVGIIDTGVDISHPDLSANVGTNPGEIAGNGVDDDGNTYIDDVNGWDFFGGDNTVYDAADGDNHGTHVAGTIGGVGGNGIGIAGVAWNVKLLTGKFLGPNGGTTANAVKAVDYFTGLKTAGVNIVATNNSWGGGGYTQALYDAIERANTAGVLFIAAAGNSSRNNDSRPHYPSSYDNTNVIAVASITSTGDLSSFSNYGKTSVDLGAPGSDILSTLPNGTYGSYNGTSMATPHVTGAAVLLSAGGLAGDEVLKAAILDTATATSSLGGKTVTGGRLNVGVTSAPVEPEPAPDPSAPISLTAAGRKVKSTKYVDLTWSGATTAVDIHRNGALLVASTDNDGAYTDTITGKGGGTFTYQVCEAGAKAVCSNEASVTF